LSDESDGDEIFILMDGKKIWPTEKKFLTINDENTKIDLVIEIEKGQSFNLELWDHDTLSANDLLGKLIIEANNHGHFVTDFIKTGSDGSKYALEYEFG